LDQLTSNQLSEWEAYDQIDPIGTWRDDYLMAYIASVLTNIFNAEHCEKDKEPIRTAPIDFMPIWDVAEQKKQTKIKIQRQKAEDMKNILMSFVASHNKNTEAQEKVLKRPPTLKHRKNGPGNIIDHNGS